jgi:hypothetical protein
MAIITLITDFGTRDHYVAVMKGVILGIAPDVRIVDVTHEIEPHNVLDGAFVLQQTWYWYPPGTIHVVVVDPGVGSDRRVVLTQLGGHYVVAPDNGLMTLVARDRPDHTAFVLDHEAYFLPSVSSTFHGRDIMAPVAAHLARGIAPAEFGARADRLHLLSSVEPIPLPAGGFEGRVVYVDRFGNLVTNIGEPELSLLGDSVESWHVLINGLSIGPIRKTYAEVPEADALAVMGGSGLLEVAVNRGRALDRFGPTDALKIEIQRAH